MQGLPALFCGPDSHRYTDSNEGILTVPMGQPLPGGDNFLGEGAGGCAVIGLEPIDDELLLLVSLNDHGRVVDPPTLWTCVSQMALLLVEDYPALPRKADERVMSCTELLARLVISDVEGHCAVPIVVGPENIVVELKCIQYLGFQVTLSRTTPSLELSNNLLQ
jgi:hypothetical protein